jgi:DNA-binding MarR family transcriptional regulator
MSSIDGLPVEKLHPAGRQMVAAMMAKGWIKRRSDDRGRAIYWITETGQEAFER